MIIINKALTLLHKVNKFFITIFAIIASITLGMALIAFVTLSKIVVSIENIYNANTHLMNIVLFCIIFIPITTIIFEKLLVNRYSKVK
ncbi:hypothetical protein CLOACE_19490 [Clostridium acetireducens DSM 10703]|uniref:Uncharacterized protein n=1 Tax=Clostridium acetireducens DSM 10703 TaxID=1121290 RepID=A0A1E8EXC5_9CLOT|nr:hypothetical protein [Clostridium acetireducens]OFI05028.1 hypothetical protein CLOACE_19490 [Clostridium acetireducens DSM 10703]